MGWAEKGMKEYYIDMTLLHSPVLFSGDYNHFTH